MPGMVTIYTRTHTYTRKHMGQQQPACSLFSLQGFSIATETSIFSRKKMHVLLKFYFPIFPDKEDKLQFLWPTDQFTHGNDQASPFVHI